ncbi:MAG: DUF2807 domain-containing protein [Bacteroidales bacterium]|nr:DUF2807 domain-containing protein [Bacteroidales bacterium]
MKTKRTMTVFIAFLLMGSTGMMGSCILIGGEKGDGNVVKEERTVSGFTSLEVSGAFNVFLYQGKSESLTVEADQNLMEFIITEVKGDKLEIYTKGTIRKATKLNIYLTFEELEMIDISGAVSLVGEDKMIFHELNLDGSGATEIDLIMDVELLEADLSGASEINLSGEAKFVSLELSGASEISAFDFKVVHFELDVSGAADANIYVTENLDVEISGAASVRYKGSPHVNSEISGAGSIKRD